MLHNIQRGLVLFAFILLAINALGQQTKTQASYLNFDKKYGLDQTLYNGFKYYPKHTQALGHPFLDLGKKTSQGKSYGGMVFYKQDYFTAINLKYDIYQQQIVLVSKDSYGAKQQIVLPISEQDSCWIQNRLFLNGSLFKSKFDIVEVVQVENQTVVIEQYKEYKPNGNSTGYTHTYTKFKKTNYLYDNGNLVWLKNNKTFIKFYPLEIHADLKNYIRKNKLKIKKASTHEINKLLNFSHRLIQEL